MICDCISNEFSAFAKSKGAALYVVISPMLWELEKNEHPFWDCKEKLMNQSIPVIDLFPAFSEVEDFKTLYWQNDRHNNHLGHALWAEVVYNEIIAEVSSMKDTSDVVTPN